MLRVGKREEHITSTTTRTTTSYYTIYMNSYVDRASESEKTMKKKPHDCSTAQGRQEQRWLLKRKQNRETDREREADRREDSRLHDGEGAVGAAAALEER